MLLSFVFFFLFKQKTAYEMRISDWSSDVCSSDLAAGDVSVNVHTNILTWGDDAIAIAAQPIGGGGGVGGVQALEGTRLAGAKMLVGGYMAGAGGAVSVVSDRNVNTAGDGAYGVVAQSIGGGGGLGVIGVGERDSVGCGRSSTGRNGSGGAGCERERKRA